VAKARPEVIVHQMTGISLTHAGKPDLKHFNRWAVPTIRLRTEGTDHLLAAAEATGVSHFVAQGYANWNGIRALTEKRGFSNGKAKRKLRYPSWRQGFKEGLV
jgi:hypothetical protein